MDATELLIADHRQVKNLFSRFDRSSLAFADKAFADKVKRLKRDVEHHVAEEETELFPRLRQSLSKTRLNDLRKELESAKASAPTRPHPHQPPATSLTGKAVGAVDKVRDRVSGR